MIILNMSKKHSPINVPISAFTTENNVLILQIKLLQSIGVDYDLTGKAITAIFKDKPETGLLQVIDGIIQLPITSNLIEVGINEIQLSFRWGIDSHELSQIMLWNINEGLIPTIVELPQDDVDLLTSLIYEVNILKNELNDIYRDIEGAPIITPSFTYNWVKYDIYPVGYYKDALGFVHFQGRVKSGTVGAFIFTLPVEYRRLRLNTFHVFVEIPQ